MSFFGFWLRPKASENKALLQAGSALAELRKVLTNLLRLPLDERARETARRLATMEDIDRIIARTVGIAGEEGAGKSTLVNAIFGRAFVPIDADRPGTVAPIVISSTTGQSLQYSVELRDGQLKDATAADFARHLLQRHNRDNVQGVEQGRIKVATPHLAEGLSLIDLPGLEGVADVVRDEARGALSGIHGGIVVVNDRNVAPGLRTGVQLKELGRDIDAVVCNLRSSKLLDDVTRRPLPDETVASNIDEIRSFAFAEFERLGLPLSADRIFAFHVPAMTGLQPHAGTIMSAPAHLDQIAGFVGWFREQFGHESAGRRLTDAADVTGVLLGKFDEHLKQNLELVKGLRRSRRPALSTAAQTLELRRKALHSAWQQALLEAAYDTEAQKANAAMARAAALLKQRLEQLGANSRSSLSASSWNWKAADRDRIARTLNEGTRDAAQELEGEQQRTSMAMCATLHRAADTVVAREDDALGFLKVAADRISTAANPVRLWHPPRFQAEKSGFRQMEWMRSSYSIDRLLQQIAQVAMDVDASPGGAIRSRFATEIAALRDRQEGLLLARLDCIEALTKDRRSAPLATRASDLAQVLKLLRKASRLERRCRKYCKRLSAAANARSAAEQATRKRMLDRHQRLQLDPSRASAANATLGATQPAHRSRSKWSPWYWVNLIMLPASFRRLHGSDSGTPMATSPSETKFGNLPNGGKGATGN